MNLKLQANFVAAELTRRKSASSRWRLRAFTLIELLLAVGIFAIVLAAINTVFYSALHLRAASSRWLDESVPVQRALEVLRRDLQGAMPPDSNAMAGDFKIGTVSSSAGMAANNGLQFFTCSGVINDDDPWGDLQKVTYELRDPTIPSTTHGKDLIRSVTRNLLPTTAEELAEQWLMGGVENLEFESFDGADWRAAWDTSLGDSGLPQAVRVRVQLTAQTAADTRNRQPIEMLVLLETQSRTNQTSSGGAQ